MKKKILNLSILFIILYLVISGIYILIHINFGDSPEIVGMGFSESDNVIRTLMGIPKTYTTYQGISPIYLLEVVIKFALGTVLIVYLYRKLKNK